MRRRKTVYVSKRDIDLGLVGNCALCPVARAISRALGYQVLVVGLFWRKAPDGPRQPYLPPKASKFIDNFDSPSRYKAMLSPFSFTLFYNT